MIIGIFNFFDSSDLKQTFLIVIAAINFAIEYLSWGTPKWFKKWANRNYAGKDESAELTEEEIMKSMEES